MPFSESIETLAHGLTIRTIVTGQTLWTSVSAVGGSWLRKSIVPFETSDWLLLLQEVNSLLHGCRTLIGRVPVGVSVLSKNVSVESCQHLLKVRNEPLRVSSNPA